MENNELPMSLEEALMEGHEVRERIGMKLDRVVSDYVADHFGMLPTKIIVGWADASDGMGVLIEFIGIPCEIDEKTPIRMEAL